MKQYLSPLTTVRRSALGSIFGGLALLTIYLYQGNHAFFTRHFGSALEGSPFAEWTAHGYQFAAAALLMLALPAAWVVLGARERLADCGLALGDWRFGLKFLAVGMVALALPLYLNAGSPEFQAEYPLAKIAGRSAAFFVAWELCYLVYYVSWEFFFRGFWQIGLAPAMGAIAAMALQTTASTIMHIGKPEGETLTAIAGGAALGLLALRTRSIVWGLALHWYVGMMTDLFCLMRAGAGS